MRRSSGCGSDSLVDSVTCSEAGDGCRSNIAELQVGLPASPLSIVRPGGRGQPEARVGEFDLHRNTPRWDLWLKGRLDLDSNASTNTGSNSSDCRAATAGGSASPGKDNTRTERAGETRHSAGRSRDAGC